MDVTVIGGGVFGLSVAYACASRGATVRLYERKAIGSGASGGLVGALAPHVPENWNPKKAFQLESLLMAEAFWGGVSDVSDLPTGYARLGRLQPLEDAVAVDRAQHRAVGAAALWQGWAAWRVVQAAGGWEPLSPTGWLVEDTLTARIQPRLACLALAGALRELGGEVVMEEIALDSPPPGAVVWACGAPGLVELSEAFGTAVGRGEKGQALALGYAAPDLPQLFSGGLHIVPHQDGTVAIGSTSEREYDAAETVDDQLDTLHARALTICPALIGAPVVARWAGLRPRANSRAPMLGAWPFAARSGQYIANGGFKIGFGMAPKVAQVMADLVLDGRDTIPQGFRVEDSLPGSH